MARHKGSPAQFLRRLEAIIAQTGAREIVDADGLASALGMTWRNLKVTYIDPDPKFPILKVGSEGRAYQFKLRVVLNYLVRQTKALIAQNEARNARQAERLKFDVPDEDRGLSIDQIARQIDVMLKVQAEKRRQQGEIDPAATAQFLVGLYQEIRDALLGAGSVADPIGFLSTEQRARIDDHQRDMLLAVKARIGKFIEEHCADSIPAGAF